MRISSIGVMLPISAVSLCSAAIAQQPDFDVVGTAILAVEAEPPDAQGAFVFNGVPGGVTAAGSSISVSGLTAAEYVSRESGAPAGLRLVSVACDDESSATPSQGDIETRKARFNVDDGETVTCVFSYKPTDLAEDAADAPGLANSPDLPDSPGLPGSPAEPSDDGPASSEAGDCAAPAMVPKPGPWTVSNHAGQMVCGSLINMPLTPSQQTGTLEIRDCGWTVIGTGMAEDTAPLTMRAVDETGSRYSGEVGGSQDGIPMTIDFTWQLNSDEWIVGELTSEVTQQGMTCNMSRPFELRHAGP